MTKSFMTLREKTMRRKFTPEVRERAVRMVLENRGQRPSLWAVIQSIAPKIGCTSQTLNNWIRQHERDSGESEGLSTSERDRIKAMEREIKELRQANEILQKASAYFAQATHVDSASFIQCA